MNVATIIGRMVADPELRYTESGQAVCNYRLAVRNPFDKNDEPDYIPCVSWGKAGEVVANYHKKGDEIAVTGRMSSGFYTNTDGERVYTMELNTSSIHLVSGRKDNNEDSNNSNNNSNNSNNSGNTRNNRSNNSNNRSNNSSRNTNNSRGNNKS